MGKLNFNMPFGTRMFLAYNETVWERKEESKEKELVSEGRGVRGNSRRGDWESSVAKACHVAARGEE
jgi:hypothetical protein